MKRKLQMMVTASAASVLAFSAMAQDEAISKSDRPAYTSDSLLLHSARTEQLGRAEKASDLIGMEVKSYQDDKLGKVDDLAVDLQNGRIVQVILSTGGFLGLGSTLVAVPPGALHWDASNKVVHMNADKEKLKAAPRFETTQWASCCDSNHVNAVYRYHGEEPYFAIREGTSNSSNSSNSPTGLGQVQKASQIMDMSVKNLQAENLGDVENLVVDLSAGRVVAVIISSGGFLGAGDALSAVPPSALRLNPARDVLQLDVTKEVLGKAPHFKSNQWPEVGDPTYADGFYRAYRVEPYFTTNSAPAADNTARNVRDRGNRTLTSLDQGNSAADRDRTAQIRKEILALKGMSVNARNVKIITIDGQVTLRGPVNNADEKRLINGIADRIAKSANVDNQLEVSVTTSSNN